MENLFTSIKSNDNIIGIDLYDCSFLFTTYANESTFFLKVIASTEILVDTFKVFSCFSGLKPNINKSQIASLGILKWTQMDLANGIIKKLGIHFSYNKKIQTERNYLTTVKKIQKALNAWISRTNYSRRKNFNFQNTGNLQNCLFIFDYNCSEFNIGRNSKNSETFLWYSSKPKINHKTLCSTFEDGALKNVDVKSTIINLQCSWVKKLYDGNHHNWKIIPLYLINKYFGKNFHFHSNLSFNLALVDSFPEFYKQIFINWSSYFVSNSKVPSCIQFNFLWNKKHI